MIVEVEPIQLRISSQIPNTLIYFTKIALESNKSKQRFQSNDCVK